MQKPALEIDVKGYRQTLSNKGKPRILVEALANALDTEATVITVSFKQEKGRAELFVKDNDPDGFANLRDSYTLFAPSTRRDDYEKSGRFGQGDKEVVAICVDGGSLHLVSTKGTIHFNSEGRIERSDEKTSTGTELTASLKLNRFEADEFVELVTSLIVPEAIIFKFNNEVLPHRKPVKVVRETLDTVTTDEEGNLKETRRQTSVELYEPQSGETVYIYELGIPVVEHDGRFHVNIKQKVPLNSARDNVRPAYLRKLRELVLNSTHEFLSVEDMQSSWVRQVLPTASPEALRAHKDTVYGRDAVTADPFNPEANKRALDDGRTLIPGRAYDKVTWARLNSEGITQPSGQVFPTGIPTSPDGVPPIEVGDWTPAMHALAAYTRQIGEFLLGFEPRVEYLNKAIAGPHAIAMWGNQEITFNLRFLGKRWPEQATQEQVDELLIHEFAHHIESDHLTDRYNATLCKFGARLRRCTVQWTPAVELV